jgi:uncharacterized protein (TIGR00255 family)
MTGFARQSAESPLGTLTCEIRAVNHRYLDVQFRIPDELRPSEVELRQQISEIIRRGKVECSLHLRRAPGEQGQLNEALVTQLRARIDELQNYLPDCRAVDPIDILRWPGVIEDPEISVDSLLEMTRKLLAETLQSIAVMRASEGKRISAMLQSRCEDILAIAASVRERMPDILEAVRTKQKERIEKLDIDADPMRLETELALIAQKLDVDEELDRLGSHVSEVRSVMASDEAVGRRLDFLMQELNREANTLGSKSADTDTTKAAVDLKVLIEQMREQVQNVE